MQTSALKQFCEIQGWTVDIHNQYQVQHQFTEVAGKNCLDVDGQHTNLQQDINSVSLNHLESPDHILNYKFELL